MDKPGETQQQESDSALLRQLLKLKLWLIERFRIGERQFMLLWAALIGLLGALSSEVFRRATDILHFLATGSDVEIISSFARLPLWQRVAVPTVGRPHPVDRESSDEPFAPENNDRLHGSNRCWQRRNLGAGEYR
jgi:hypothetical protein